VKECYYYLGNTPTHAYMKFLYKYTQVAFPYDQLLNENRGRGKYDREFELTDTGVFEDSRYFDVVVEYAKADVEDILARITVHNRGPERARLHVLPTFWFRNTWSWGRGEPKPWMKRCSSAPAVIELTESTYGKRWAVFDKSPDLLFTENETNNRGLYNDDNASGYAKDGINDYIVHGSAEAVNPAQVGTKPPLTT
jgi:hypothetical protein